ncbi:MAG: Rieske (2Fe-2S) protein [Pseudomonadota bacterium]
MNWTPVILQEDVPPGVVVPSRIDETELAVWCSPSGQYHAWSDRCPHRGMRLSHGFVRGETLACIYHGWQYDAKGACAYIPAHPSLRPPKSICVPTYPCAPSGGVIWAALEDPTDAPPDLEGRRPVRSMAVGRSAKDVAQHFGIGQQPLIPIEGPYDAVLALQSSGAAQSVIHALAAPAHDRKAVSRWLEALRVDLEGVPA